MMSTFAILAITGLYIGLSSGRIENPPPESMPLQIHITNSSYECTQGQCVFHHVGFYDGSIVFVSDDEGHNDNMPSVLCSIVDKPQVYTSECTVRVVSTSAAVKLFEGVTCSVNTSVLFARVNPYNPYHVLFEEMIPAYAMMSRVGGLPTEPAEAIKQLSYGHWAAFISDRADHDHISTSMWSTLMPDVKLLKHGKCWTQTLVAGNQGACAHWGHCSRRSFSPVPAAETFTSLVLQRLGLETGHQNKLRNRKKIREATCRITIVQRYGTRTISNVQAIVQLILSIDTPWRKEVQVVNFSDYPFVQQVAIAHATDIFILVHGGALVHTAWLPHGALIMDIYPYQFPIEHHSGLIHWVRSSLPHRGLGHLPYQILTSEGQVGFDRPLPKNCQCSDCAADLFWHTNSLTCHTDDRLKAHFTNGLSLWRNQRYTAPQTYDEFLALSSKPTNLTNSDAVSCKPA